MTEYIEKEKAITTAFAANAISNTAYRNVCDTANRLRLIPAADVAPVRHGRWREVEHGESGHLCECSVCKEWLLFYYGFVANYYPNCGAKMDLEDGDGK